MASLGPVAPPPSPASSLLASAPPAPVSPFVSSGAPGFPPSASGFSAGLNASVPGDAPPSASRGSILDFAGASGASDSPDDAFLYYGFDESLVKWEKEVPALGKADFSKAFHEVVSLITSFFPHAKPSSSSERSCPWMNVFDTATRSDPRIFLALFDKLSSVSKEVNEKFSKAADAKKRASTALLRWGDIYRLGDLDMFHYRRGNMASNLNSLGVKLFLPET